MINSTAVGMKPELLFQFLLLQAKFLCRRASLLVLFLSEIQSLFQGTLAHTDISVASWGYQEGMNTAEGSGAMLVWHIDPKSGSTRIAEQGPLKLSASSSK